MPKSGIYQIRNLNNGKVYVGSSTNLAKRKWTHFDALRRGDHHSQYLQRSYNKHGETAFIFETLVICHPTMLIWYEQRFLDQWRPEYNLASIANIPEGSKGLGSRPCMKGNQNALGNKSRLGQHHTEGTRRKISRAMMGNKSRLGMETSEETKGKISKSLMGHTHSEESRRKISLNNGVRKLSIEDVVAVREWLKLGIFQKDIAQAFGISQSNVSQIKTGRRNRYIP